MYLHMGPAQFKHSISLLASEQHWIQLKEMPFLSVSLQQSLRQRWVLVIFLVHPFIPTWFCFAESISVFLCRFGSKLLHYQIEAVSFPRGPADRWTQTAAPTGCGMEGRREREQPERPGGAWTPSNEAVRSASNSVGDWRRTDPDPTAPTYSHHMALVSQAGLRSPGIPFQREGQHVCGRKIMYLRSIWVQVCDEEERERVVLK